MILLRFVQRHVRVAFNRTDPMTQQRQHAPTIDLVSGLMLLALATLLGGGFFFAEIALRDVPPLTIALHRVFWAVPVLFLFVKWLRLHIPKSIRAWV